MDSKKDKQNMQIAISFAWEIGYSIIFPLLFLALGGRLLDRKFDTGPFLFITGIILSIFITTYVIVKKSMKIIEATTQATEDDKHKKEEKITEDNKSLNSEDKK